MTMTKPVDYDIVAQISYMDLFISEVLRMYHIANRVTERRATEDTIVQSIKIDKGNSVRFLLLVLMCTIENKYVKYIA